MAWLTRPIGQQPPVHLAIILDGNGRWALRRGMGRSQGHRAGARAVRAVVEKAPSLGVRWLTLYAFSSDNWQRPAGEVETLLQLLEQYLEQESNRCRREGVAIEVLGRRDRIGPSLLSAIERAEGDTRGGRALTLRVAIDYSARDAIRRAALALARLDRAEVSSEEMAGLIAAVDHGSTAPPVDLLIRTGGEQRLSDFLLWESAYAEPFFVDTPWPEFSVAELRRILMAFRRRDRRFGRVATEVAGQLGIEAV